MLHCDDDELSIIALGEPASASDEAHLQSCPRCQSRLDQLSAVVTSARGITEADRPTDPPPAVWEAITSELGMDSLSNVTSLAAAPSRRRRAAPWLLAGAAAVAGVLVGVVVTAGVTSGTGSADLLASASLGPIDDSGFSGSAEVEQTTAGPILHVDVPGLPDVDDGYYEVWMATPDATTMVAIGTMNPGSEATFPLPAGMAVDAFPVVDVSVEHFDGDAGHSAISVVRGQLQT